MQLANTHNSIVHGDFTLVCRSRTKGKLSDRIKISNKITNAIAFDGTDQLEVAIRFVDKGKHVDKGVGFEVYQNSPNPWVQKTNLYFYTPVPMRIQFRILDQFGRLVYTQEKYFEKGYHFWAVDKAAIENAGVYYYELKGDLGTGVGRMILLKE